MAKDKRMTRQLRAYDETVTLIDLIARQTTNKTYADVLEEWAVQLYPEVYAEVKTNMRTLSEKLAEDSKRKGDKQ